VKPNIRRAKESFDKLAGKLPARSGGLSWLWRQLLHDLPGAHAVIAPKTRAGLFTKIVGKPVFPTSYGRYKDRRLNSEAGCEGGK